MAQKNVIISEPFNKAHKFVLARLSGYFIKKEFNYRINQYFGKQIR